MGRQEKQRKRACSAQRHEVAGAAVAQAQPEAQGAPQMVAHTVGCPCAACERGRTARMREVANGVRKRRRTYEPGSADPEHLTGWSAAASGEMIANWIKLHSVEMDARMHVTALELRPSLLAHLDEQVAADAQDLEPRWLWTALLILDARKPLEAELLRAHCIEGTPAAELAQAQYLSRWTLKRRLEAALDELLAIYGRLVLAAQQGLLA